MAQRGGWQIDDPQISCAPDSPIRGPVDTLRNGDGKNLFGVQDLPSRDEVSDLIDKLMNVLFPGYSGSADTLETRTPDMSGEPRHLVFLLEDLVERCIRFGHRIPEQSPDVDVERRSLEATEGLLHEIPTIRDHLFEDVQAAYDGDPAAKSHQEVILSYPALLAIAIYRLAHVLHLDGVPLLPRMLTEKAHSLTGIDIHPGARIGRAFFIDHGTGTVIGETAIIGDNVKLYQGVTLGALSLPRNVRRRGGLGGKRHPTIEDNVVVYSGATILGGETVIGHDSIIGGNCWIINSVPPNTKVSLGVPNQQYRRNGQVPEEGRY